MTAPTVPHTWTGRVRARAMRDFPPDQLLPEHQPVYVASWIYVFGVLTLAAFVVVLVSGGVLALKGPQWWHRSSTGHYFNSLHLWSVELFMAFMVIHLWGKFFMAAWLGKRAMTWVTGAVLPGLHRHCVHRLSDPVQLRLPVDQHPGERWAQLGRDRSILQRHRLRADVDVAHRTVATDRRRGDRRAHSPGASPRCRTADGDRLA